jgi:hypothetical protein
MVSLLIAAFGFVAVNAFTPDRADAAPLRPAQPLLSARSAGLSTERGVLRLGNVGMPSRNLASSLERLAAGRANNPADTISSVYEFSKSMCQDTAWGGSIPVIGNVIGSVCGAILTVVIGVIKVSLDFVTTVMLKMFQPLMAWMLKESIGVATGYSQKCADPAAAQVTRACNGKPAEARVLSVARGQTAATLVTLSFLMALPLLLAAVISALIKQSLPELGKTLLRLPFVWILSTVAIVILAVAVGVRDGVVTYIINQSGMMNNIDKFMNTDSFLTVTTTGEGIGQLLAVTCGLLGAILLFIVFLLGDIVVLTSVLFIPLTTVGLIWGGTSKWFKRVGELSFAFIIGKVVVVSILAMTFELLGKA